jgi:hypothetical protein
MLFELCGSDVQFGYDGKHGVILMFRCLCHFPSI